MSKSFTCMWMMFLMSPGCAVALNKKDVSCTNMLYCCGYFPVTCMKQNLTMTNYIDKVQPCQSSREQ